MATFSKRVTFVIWNRIGFLEGILPVFFELKQQYPNIHFVILILELNKEMVIGPSKFYDLFCERHNIQMMDTLSFLPTSLRLFESLFRFISSLGLKYSGQSNPLVEKITRKFFPYFRDFLRANIDYKRLQTLIDESDMLLVNEAWWKKLDKVILECLVNYKNKLIIVPHGSVFLAIPEKYSENVGVWGIHFKMSEKNILSYQSHVPLVSTNISFSSLGILNDDRSIFAEILGFVGYPSFDKFWFEKINSLMQNHRLPFKGLVPKKNRSFRCLFLIRNVFDKPHQDQTTQQELEIILRAIREEILERYSVEILVKPHPIQSRVQLKEILDESGIRFYSIVQEPISITLPESDFAITFQTSGSYFPLLYGLPCIHIYKLDYLNQPLFNLMEQDLKRFVTDLDDLPNACRALMQELHTSQHIANDVEHMRQFYPDGATNLIIDQIKGYLE